MIAADAMIACIRAAGIDLFIIPRSGPAEGVAWVGGGKFINVYGAGRDLDVARVLAHELAHHARHMDGWTSLPRWRKEMEAEGWMLEFLSGFVTPEEMERLVVGAKMYLRTMVQRFLDHGITNHGEVPVGRWLRCEIPAHLAEDHQPWLDDMPQVEEIPF